MKSATPELIALLASDNFIMADLYTFTLRNGVIYRFSNFDVDITYGGVVYSKNGLLLRRNGVKLVTGIQVDSLSITAYSTGDDIEGIGFFRLIANGGLDGATLRLDRLFFRDVLIPVGSLWVFSGRVSDAEVTRFEAKLEIKSDIELLNIQMPRNLYQPSCVHMIYDAGCKATKTPIAKSVLSGSTKQKIIASISQAAGYFNEGMIEFTSGANTGVKRTIKLHTLNTITLALALPNTPTTGDRFNIYAGCDRTMITCSSKFNNINNFRGYPFLPPPETIQ